MSPSISNKDCLKMKNGLLFFLGFFILFMSFFIGLWVGGWFMLIGGIVCFVDAVKMNPTNAIGITEGLIRIIFSFPIGFLTTFFFWLIGAYFLKKSTGESIYKPISYKKMYFNTDGSIKKNIYIPQGRY
jgi:hypothetical protein